MARGCEHFAVEVEFGKDDKVTIHVSSPSGIDLRYIPELLKHANSKSTEIYTYMSKANIARIRNPHNILFKEENV